MRVESGKADINYQGHITFGRILRCDNAFCNSSRASPFTRAIEVMEKMGVPAARDLLKSLADDSSTSPRAREAQAALSRLRN